MRVITWNLFHGRAQPAAGRELLAEFAAMLRGWSWDLALLQEVPPWWPAVLARTSGAEQRTALTSRNLGLGVRRALARRRPDLLKSNGGGCNAVLSRGPIASYRQVRLRVWPERRVAQLVRLSDGTRRGQLPRQHAHRRWPRRSSSDCGLSCSMRRSSPPRRASCSVGT